MPKDLKVAGDKAFFTWMKNAKKEIFRFEAQPQYRVDFETETLNYFKKHGKVPPPTKADQEWLDLLATAKKRGANYWRIRRLSKKRTTYEKFEVASYKQQAPYGIKVWAFTRDYAEMPELESLPYAFEYWMFDQKAVFFVIYDLTGKYWNFYEYLGDPAPYVAVTKKLKKISKRIV